MKSVNNNNNLICKWICILTSSNWIFSLLVNLFIRTTNNHFYCYYRIINRFLLLMSNCVTLQIRSPWEVLPHGSGSGAALYLGLLSGRCSALSSTLWTGFSGLNTARFVIHHYLWPLIPFSWEVKLQLWGVPGIKLRSLVSPRATEWGGNTVWGGDSEWTAEISHFQAEMPPARVSYARRSSASQGDPDKRRRV